jgi:hypothetical protein
MTMGEEATDARRAVRGCIEETYEDACDTFDAIRGPLRECDRDDHARRRIILAASRPRPGGQGGR